MNPWRVAAGLGLALLITAAVGHGQEGGGITQAPAGTPSLEEICETRFGEDTLAPLADAFSDLERLGKLTAPPSAPGAPSAPLTAARKIEIVQATVGSYVEQATHFQNQARELIDAARRAPDPAERQQLFRQANETLDKRDGLIQTATMKVVAMGGPELQRATGFKFRSEALEQLKDLSQAYGTQPGREADIGRVSPAAQAAYDGRAQRALDAANQGTGSKLFCEQNSCQDRPPVPRPATVPPPGRGSGDSLIRMVPPPPRPEPGGIKFSGKRAGELAQALDVTSIEYDSGRGRIILGGRASSQAFDLDVFADALRLAVEEYEPFFSLDPSDAADWDAVVTAQAEMIVRKYRRGADIAQRVRAASPEGQRRDGRTYYYTTVDIFDPDIARASRNGKDVSTILVFSPAWLRYSKIGTILYEADLAIKGVASGFVERDGAIEPAATWDLPDFHPDWLRPSESTAGRANFQLAVASVRRDGNRLDLGAVRPELFVTDRMPGTSEDLPPSERARAISAHFDRNWEQYVTRIPEIARLQMVFRAYVAARFLAEHHPGLAASIRRMPRTVPPPQPPLRIVQPTVIRVAFEAGRPVPVVGDSYFDLGAGYGGGIRFGLEAPPGKESPVVLLAADTGAPQDWWRGLVAAATLSGDSYVVDDGRAAAIVEFDRDLPPVSWHLTVAAPGAALALALAAWAATRRQFRWQAPALGAACRHCATVHRALGVVALAGDATAVAAVGYLVVLPMMAAGEGAAPSLGLTLAALSLLAAALVLALAGALARTLASPGSRPFAALASALLAGGRTAAVVIALALFHGGWSAGAVAGAYTWLLSPQVGERVLALIGGVQPVVIAAAAGLAGALFSCLLIWAAPFALNSRPLTRRFLEAHAHA